jgi:predicted nuclease of restriction endonuclease-like (RecB) superfamily
VTRRKSAIVPGRPLAAAGYDVVLGRIVNLLESARRAAARTVNAVMTATYWEIGRRIVEHEQGGARRAEYGEELLARLSTDLTRRFGRGFSVDNLENMRRFYVAFGPDVISETPIRKSPPPKSETASRISQTPSAQSRSDAAGAILRPPPEEPSALATLAARFPLPWSHYVKLLGVHNPEARRFYETEALRSAWTVRQLARQIETQFYERTALSRNKAAMLRKGAVSQAGDAVTPEEEIKDPYVLEFLDLKDEYSETDLEDALIRQLEGFLLELGGDFAFVGRQRRLRIGDEWYRLDLLFFHRRLRCLVVIDLKLGKFTHADAGQMHLYLNYAREHWLRPGENPPVGLILCAQKDAAVARYALEGLPNKVLAAEYRTTLPDEKLLAAEIDRTRAALERGVASGPRGRCASTMKTFERTLKRRERKPGI